MKIRRLSVSGRRESQRVADGTTDRAWADLTPDLLSLIANRLSLIQLLAFRGVCQSWRSASSTASAYPESSENTKPSFIVYDEQNKKCSLWYRTDKEEGTDGGKMYWLNIPELENATCLASNQGWLLLYKQGSMFFFCPFSRARIDLPDFPESELPNHVAAFSEPPTSKECIISVAESCSSFMKLHVLHRGDQAWTKHERNSPHGFLGTIIAALYVGKESSFYFMDDKNKMLRFSVKKKTWCPYVIVTASTSNSVGVLPFDFRLNYFHKCNMKSWMVLQDDVSISICGTLLPGQKVETYACSENMEASNGSANSKLKGIWIEPRFLQIPENQGWPLTS